MPRIFDNIELSLAPGLKEALGESGTSLDVCVGYFNLRGWGFLAGDVDDLPQDGGRPAVRLLVGMQGQPSDELREAITIGSGASAVMDMQTAARVRNEVIQGFRDQLTWGYPTRVDERAIRILRRQLLEGRVQIKLFLRHRLHAKIYLVNRLLGGSPRVGFVGSSNLTFSGLGGQGELNVDVLDHDATAKLARWFDDKWTDRFCIDISEDLAKVLDESWASERLLSPYLIHLKIAYHLSRDARAGLSEYGLPELMRQQLLEYQSAAVRITARHLMAQGGAIVGDVVGLGKTMVASAVALLLQEDQGYESLIICPKNLVEMWESYVHGYRLFARVQSLSMAHRELQDLRRYRLLILDESHNLRNSSRRDYAAVRDYISTNDSRVLLLTATPFNRSMADVASQLALFIDEDADLGIRPESAIAAIGEFEFLSKCDDKPSTLRAFRLSEEIDDWQRLLSQFLVRRTRNFIRDNYATADETGRFYLTFEGGGRQYLPERTARPLQHTVSPEDPSSEMASESVLDAIDSLILPRYELAKYIKRSDVPLGEEEKDVVDALERGAGNLSGFTRTMLMKRLSSSGAVFLISLRRHLVRNMVYLSALGRSAGLVPIGSFNEQALAGDATEGVGGWGQEEAYPAATTPTFQDGEEALARLLVKRPAGVSWLRAELFSSDLLTALEHDNVILKELLDRFGGWNPASDSKLEALAELVITAHGGEKVLVFTEYADTAAYVAEALERRGVQGVGLATGDSENPTLQARRFSPHSNAEIGGLPEGYTELRVLVATDVLSEGQNLQDAAIVLNFDLPWAIIKLIQRAGRVDRIGQQSPIVLVYSFLPDEGVEAVIALRQRIAGRLQASASVFGSDERFLNTPGEAHVIEQLFDENAEFPEEQDDGTDNVDYSSAAYEIWRNAQEMSPALAEAARNLPDVTYSTRGATEGETEGVVVYTLTTQGFDRLVVQVADGPVTRLTPMRALALTRCEPEAPGLPPLLEHHAMVRSAVEHSLQHDELGTEGNLTGIRRRVYERLRDATTGTNAQLFGVGSQLDEALQAIYRFPLTEQAKQSLARALRDRTIDDVAVLVLQLHEDGVLTIEMSGRDDEVRIVCSMGVRVTD